MARWNYRPIINGQRKDPMAVIIRGLLRGAAVPYGIGAAYRNRQFDRGAREVLRCGVPVVSVGNITTGGTGKTPIVCYLANWFQTQDVRVVIVSRGYGRGDAEINDEAMELRARLPDVPHVQNPDRVAAAREAVQRYDAQIVLMDDGFQHRRLHRDVNIVVIDATCPFGYGYVLPRGLLRERLTGMRRADLAILTRCDARSEEVLSEIEYNLRKIHSALPIFRSNHKPTNLREFPDHLMPASELDGANVVVLSAIGNPRAFHQTVVSLGATIIESIELPDHDSYGVETVARLEDRIRGRADRVSRVVCTHKDLVKLRTKRLGGVPLVAIQIELVIESNEQALQGRLEAIAIPTTTDLS